MVEGHCTTFLNNELQNTVEVIQNFQSRYARRAYTRSREPGVAGGIRFRIVPELVSETIDFDAELRLIAVEVENVRTGGMLTPKLQAFRPSAQMLPKQNFRQRHVPTQCPCPFDVPSRASEHSPPPHSVRSPSPEGED